MVCFVICFFSLFRQHLFVSYFTQVTRLKKSLKASKSGNSLMGDGVARAFLRATACLIGGYREALVVEVGKPVRFDEELFIASRPQKMQEYLRKMLRLQIFEQFIAERVKIFNNLEEPADEFENEVAALGDKWSSKSRYQEWIVDMKVLLNYVDMYIVKCT